MTTAYSTFTFDVIDDLNEDNNLESLMIPSYMTETIYESCTYDECKPLNFEEN